MGTLDRNVVGVLVAVGKGDTDGQVCKMSKIKNSTVEDASGEVVERTSGIPL